MSDRDRDALAERLRGAWDYLDVPEHNRQRLMELPATTINMALAEVLVAVVDRLRALEGTGDA